MAKKAFVLSLGLIALFAGCRVGEKWQKSTFLYFDTVCEVELLCPSSRFKMAEDEVRKVFAGIEEHFSPGKSDASSPQVIRLFQQALRIWRDSEGCFDITVAPLSQAWGFLDKRYRVPDPQEIRVLLEHVGMDKIKKQKDSLVFPEGMAFDWGGIAKGYGIDLAAKALITMGIENGFVNAGGDLYCWGKNPDREPWKIGIKHPRKKGFLGVISLSNLSAASTGDYQRYFEEAGVRYHHVFDPKTGYPARGKQSVTVIGPETVLCDALSTALFVSNTPEKILEKYPDYGAVIVNDDGHVSFLGKAYSFRFVPSS